MALRRKFMETKLFRAMVVSLLLLGCVWYQPHFILTPIRNVVAIVTRPVQGLFSTLAFEFRDTFHFFASVGELKKENDRLAQEVLHLSVENAKWQTIGRENDELRKELELLPRQTFGLQGAEVIGRDAAGLGNWLTVNQGSYEGITPGMPVIVYGGVLVGRVTEVFPKSARVMLLTHPESAVSGITVEGGAQGIIKGEYGLGLLFDMILQDAAIGSGDRLVTSGLGGAFPKNLLIGTLQEVHLSSDRLYKQASVISPVSSDSLRYVFIIKEIK